MVQDFFHHISPCSIGKSSSIRVHFPVCYVSLPECTLSTNGTLMVWGPVVWDSNRGTPNNPFHNGIPGIQTTNPNHPFTISWPADLCFLFLSRKSGEIDCSWRKRLGCSLLGCSLNPPGSFCYIFLVGWSLINLHFPMLFGGGASQVHDLSLFFLPIGRASKNFRKIVETVHGCFVNFLRFITIYMAVGKKSPQPWEMIFEVE